MKSNLNAILAAVLLFAALVACAKTHTGEVELRSSNDITVNGVGFDGSVHAGTKVLYTLKEINGNQNYTLRTEIALTSDGSSTADGTLTADIYTSADAFRNNASPLASAVALAAPNPNIYEVNFKTPPESSGDYVVVISGVSNSVPGIQFFYNLRLMSADAITALLDPVTSGTGTTYEAVQQNPLNPGFLNIYNGGDVSSTGVYTISLISNATATIANPQIFVYLNSTLTLTSLMLSSIPTSTDYVVTRFSAGVPDKTNAEHKDANIVTGVTFTSDVDGPFIVLKGFVSAVTYTLSIGP